ncbi:hypothetical protein JW962_01625 [Candidatus Dojkabacteria bacterium]|nr:hypothetical protein [Candidatus Dojkabacteria bacterium]
MNESANLSRRLKNLFNFTDNECNVFLHLNSNPDTSILKIARITRINRSTVNAIIEKFVHVSETFKAEVFNGKNNVKSLYKEILLANSVYSLAVVCLNKINPKAIVIRSETIAQSFILFHQTLWKLL